MAITHVVLGGNGVAGRETVRALLRRGVDVTSVGRRAAQVEGAASATADLLNAADAARVLAGAQVAYFTAGVPYQAKLWAKQWPILMNNVIDAAVKNRTHLVYLDNVYAYGAVDGPMSEQTPIRPTSAKGRVRADAIRVLGEASASRGLSFTVARSADFYGPGATTSMFNSFVTDRVSAGKDCGWFFNTDLPHSLTYTCDIGEALALIGADPAAQGRTWHIPTADALTARQLIEIAAGPAARVRVMSLNTMRIGALFNSSARESLEMAYQWNKPYVFDGSAFQSAFRLAPTAYRDGIAATLAASQTASR
ncbi:MAG: NAD-dependent epimerase/dehydratase family protein [Frankiaceae bacterium]|jgi:nucleoside-diphosphate-sugar epimerase|nr:NAD-dependent epimerase/dehydratase family protein [Frankiaceae bacterium]